MQIKSLLAAVSIAALTAGSASALEIPAGSIVPTGIIPALELQLPGTPALSGTFTFNLDTETGNYPNGNNILATVNLPAGIIFSNTVTGAAVTSPLANAVVNGGGTTGSNTVTLLVSLDDAFNGNSIAFAFDLGLNACPMAGGVVEVLAATESGTNIEEGRATTADIIAPCKSAINGVVVSDEATSDSFVALSSYTTLSPSFAGPNNPETILGSINLSIDPTVTKSLAAVTPLQPSDIDELRINVDFENFAGLATGFFGPLLTFQSAQNTLTMRTVDGSDIATFLDGTPDDLRVGYLATNTTPIATQTVNVASVDISFVDAGPVDFIPSEAGPTGALDTLQREGRAFGYFDWNSGGDGSGTVSTYRITGLTGPTDFSVTLTDSNANGTYTGSVTPDSTGEAVLFSTDLGGALPAGVVRYDFLLNLETSSTGVDVDRLLARNGIVTSYGDGANNSYNAVFNNQPNFDSDQALGSE